MASNHKAVVTFERLSHVPQDRVVNDWYFHWAGAAAPVATDYDVVAAALTQFYNTVPTGGTRAVSGYLSEDLERVSDVVIEYYEVPAVRGPLGPPKGMDVFTLGASAGGTPLPNEMAICLSYASDFSAVAEFGAGGTRPRSRHRGRVYLGPIESTVTVLEDGVTHEPTVGATPRTDIVAAAVQSFSAGSAASPLHGTDWTWGQFSKTAWLRQLVATCWVDDAWDVQRRRGQLPSTRSTGIIL